MDARPSFPFAAHGVRGFSLVEVTIAIGIFAFVVVGVLALLPAGMRMRADSAAETRGVLIAEELFAAVRQAPNLGAVVLRDGPALSIRNNETESLLLGPVVVGYPSQTTVPYGLFSRKRSLDPDGIWTTGAMPAWASANAIDTLARLSAQSLGGGFYRVSVEVRAPASIPLANSRTASFSTLVYSP